MSLLIGSRRRGRGAVGLISCEQSSRVATTTKECSPIANRCVSRICMRILYPTPMCDESDLASCVVPQSRPTCGSERRIYKKRGMLHTTPSQPAHQPPPSRRGVGSDTYLCATAILQIPVDLHSFSGSSIANSSSDGRCSSTRLSFDGDCRFCRCRDALSLLSCHSFCESRHVVDYARKKAIEMG